MKYSLEKLTAPEPNWDSAFIFIKGMGDPIGIDPKNFELRWIRDQDLLIINIPRIQDPFNPPTEGGTGPNGIVPAHPGGLAELEAHIHIDEIITINFYKAIKEVPKATAPSILTAEGENPDTAREREELLAKQKEGNKKKNPLHKAE